MNGPSLPIDLWPITTRRQPHPTTSPPRRPPHLRRARLHRGVRLVPDPPPPRLAPIRPHRPRQLGPPFAIATTTSSTKAAGPSPWTNNAKPPSGHPPPTPTHHPLSAPDEPGTSRVHTDRPPDRGTCTATATPPTSHVRRSNHGRAANAVRATHPPARPIRLHDPAACTTQPPARPSRRLHPAPAGGPVPRRLAARCRFAAGSQIFVAPPPYDRGHDDECGGHRRGGRGLQPGAAVGDRPARSRRCSRRARCRPPSRPARRDRGGPGAARRRHRAGGRVWVKHSLHDPRPRRTTSPGGASSSGAPPTPAASSPIGRSR